MTDETNPLLGTWRLNVAKSTYHPGPTPASQQITFEAVDNGLKVATTIYNADGSETLTHYIARYDGQVHPVTGLDNADHLSMQRIDALTDKRTDSKDGVVTGFRIRTVAADRRSYTVHGEGTNSLGQQFRHMLLYEKI
jgi:hypothetical protein